MFSFYQYSANAAAVASDECYEKLVNNAIKAILDDKGFEIPSSNASYYVYNMHGCTNWLMKPRHPVYKHMFRPL